MFFNVFYTYKCVCPSHWEFCRLPDPRRLDVQSATEEPTSQSTVQVEETAESLKSPRCLLERVDGGSHTTLIQRRMRQT